MRKAAQITLLKHSSQCSDAKSNNWNISRENDGSEKRDTSMVWSNYDQRLFEAALQEFPKGTADR